MHYHENDHLLSHHYCRLTLFQEKTSFVLGKEVAFCLNLIVISFLLRKKSYSKYKTASV